MQKTCKIWNHLFEHICALLFGLDLVQYCTLELVFTIVRKENITKPETL